MKDRIRYTRNLLGISQREFAKRLKTTQKVVYRWEAGTIPRSNALEKIAEISGVRREWLTSGDGEPTIDRKDRIIDQLLIDLDQKDRIIMSLQNQLQLKGEHGNHDQKSEGGSIRQ